MKNAALIICGVVCLLMSKPLSAQTNITNDYVVISTSDVSDPTPYLNALDAANWETYRLQNQRVQLTFDNGFQIELKSAIELANLGYPLNVPTYATEYPSGYSQPTLTLLSGNVIGMVKETTPVKTAN